MRWYSICSVIVAVFPLPAQGWEEFSSKKHGFKVAFPGKPTEKVETQNTADGAVEMYSATVRTKTGSVGVFLVLNKLSDEDGFDGWQDGLLTGTKGKLLSLTKIKLDDVSGREIQIKLGNGNYGRVRAYIFGKRLYQVMMTGATEDEVNTKEANAILSSFSLKK